MNDRPGRKLRDESFSYGVILTVVFGEDGDPAVDRRRDVVALRIWMLKIFDGDAYFVAIVSANMN
jgi:hypothetical protein